MVVKCDLHKYGSGLFLDTSGILASTQVDSTLEEAAAAVPGSAYVQVRGQRTWAKQFSFKAEAEQKQWSDKFLSKQTNTDHSSKSIK